MDDKDLERRLRDELGRDEWGATVAPPSLERVSERMGRRRTVRRAIGAVAALGVVGAGAAITVAVAANDGHPGADTAPAARPHRIPWTDIRHDQGSTAPCTPGGLEVKLGGSGAWHGDTMQSIDFTNTGRTACRMGSVPTATLFTPSGQAVPVHPAGVGGPLTLAPGDTANLAVGAPASCAKPAEIAKELSVRLGTAAPSARLTGAWVSLACGEPHVLWFENEGCHGGACSPLGQLDAAIEAPSVAGPGEVMDYTVTLTNPTDSDIGLGDYCPTYSESIVDAQTHGKRFAHDAGYLLNCDAVSVIRAHDSVAFAMRTQVPSDAVGDAIVGWTLTDPGGVSARAEVRIQ